MAASALISILSGGRIALSSTAHLNVAHSASKISNRSIQGLDKILAPLEQTKSGAVIGAGLCTGAVCGTYKLAIRSSSPPDPIPGTRGIINEPVFLYTGNQMNSDDNQKLRVVSANYMLGGRRSDIYEYRSWNDGKNCQVAQSAMPNWGGGNRLGESTFPGFSQYLLN